MDRLLYVASTGASHIERSQAVHANNLANVGTDGFQADMAQARAMQVFGEGMPSRVYALTENPATDQSRGALLSTSRSLDVAVSGNGYIAVAMPDGSEGYTRAGKLQVDALGQLTTNKGLPVLGDGGPIALPPYSSLDIGADGSISIIPAGQGPETLAQVERIKLVAPDPGELTKGEDGVLRRRDGGIEAASAEIGVVSGMLEQSNVNAVHEMTEIISLARQFEIEVKLMKTAEQLDEASAALVQIG